ncbi:hypothetical protein SAMN00808754_1978 [Thermanaeromonas toyohensis ToBE]|uniref:Uncharacterized protein n=1 Tax=Thermanaeromonas toyohensis ToBE TaxID=698762 RepID=A0A1W1VWY1_9FIRM|nr:hypothetical protein SAMN00808754_1978 [Thermanaeromonas toyohensis ToBE]
MLQYKDEDLIECYDFTRKLYALETLKVLTDVNKELARFPLDNAEKIAHISNAIATILQIAPNS